MVSTHSRPKAAARRGVALLSQRGCFNTQPPEGGCKKLLQKIYLRLVSTHSRPKAAAINLSLTDNRGLVSTHSRPKAAASSPINARLNSSVSTHSRPKAAASSPINARLNSSVSTHSRPKAAAFCFRHFEIIRNSFNTQPPEGGCLS